MGNGAYVPAGGATRASGTQWFTKCLIVGCGCHKDLCSPALAADVRCCCFEMGMSVDPDRCRATDQLCIARAGVKVAPAVVEVSNPLWDNHELIVVCEKQVC
mmetsp:Transcript_80190/g.175884  ORF Transcript_80190/g.175884 Transcript_80190/m.175884 type:complete len:102 (+) Transcript_80190:100-405(+)|eukprot:CAMPEP_0206452714 /NCGR_PEP_ID=MMETSP0324_2-20121206/20113_1 /ASSEMBLY_ACC=CAM_ASM_000836 /TAXON_ID=2866 /ORGANISM="Crypthecodinium cohnii, Strain Seligo" /LENGTH=101 /DNA_ID=CAMNT_0053922863 /DNA_START=66 /DNA_END=371 /DNA_ORIENTATION=-